jgi:predicted ATPase/DNA-binding SARP family transcriptional activator
VSIEVSLLGGFAVTVDGEPLPERTWRLRKARTLVKLLALAPRRTLHRGQVIDRLWPEHEPRRAANNLDQAVYAARRALGAEAIAVHDELLTLTPACAVDVDAFEDAAAAARAAGTSEAFAAAVGVFTGDLLPEDRYEAWTEPRRSLLREQFAALALELAERREREGRIGDAMACAQRVLHDDPLHEPAHRFLMACYARAGRRQDALSQFERLRDQLRRQLEAEPDAVTRALYRRLLATSGAESPSPHTLPAQLTSFLGREHELRDVGELLSSKRMITLAGAGGAGKTRLAIAAAESTADRFPGGTWFVDLGRLTDPALVAEEAATVVGIQVPAQRSSADALAQHLATRTALIVLDTCEHVIDACALLVEELLRRCPRLTILATSREPLRCGGEHIWRVPGLAPEAAAELFAARAGEADPRFAVTEANLRDVAEACARLDGMPLGIELAAARIGVLSPAQIASRLRESLDVLGAGARTALTRQQTLRATIGWSYELLDEHEATLFRRLSVFAGSFHVTAAEAVCSGGIVGERTVLDLLARLVAKSLLTVDDADAPRYRLLDTIRQFADELLEAGGERGSVESSLRAWAQRLAESHDPTTLPGSRARDVAVLDLEHDNIRAALATGLVADPPSALLLVTTVWQLWLDRNYLTEGARHLEAALAASSTPTPTRVTALLASAALAVRLGEPAEIVANVQEAEETARRIGDPRLLAHVLHVAHLYLMPSVFMVTAPGLRPGFEGIESPLDEALALADAHGADDIAASALHASALMHFYRGDVDAARTALDTALERLSRVAADAPPFFEGVTIGFPVLPEGPSGRPRPVFEQTILMFHRFARDQAVAFTLANLGVISRSQGRAAEARGLLDEALDRYRALGDRDGEALVLTGLGNWSRTFAEPDRGRAYLEDALALRVGGGDHRAIASTEWDLALAMAAAGELDEARVLFASLRERLRLADDGPGLAGVLIDWGVAEEWAGELGRAEKLLTEGAEHWNVVSRGPWLGWCWLAVADVRNALGEDEAAADALNRARDVFEQMGDHRGLELCGDAPAAVKRQGEPLF